MMPAALNAVNGSPYAIDIGHFAKTGILSMWRDLAHSRRFPTLTPQDKKTCWDIRPIF